MPPKKSNNVFDALSAREAKKLTAEQKRRLEKESWTDAERAQQAMAESRRKERLARGPPPAPKKGRGQTGKGPKLTKIKNLIKKYPGPLAGALLGALTTAIAVKAGMKPKQSRAFYRPPTGDTSHMRLVGRGKKKPKKKVVKK